MASQVEIAAMRQALDAAREPTQRISPNPRVGCVLLDPDGRVVTIGRHHGPGTAHAEADALVQAGAARAEVDSASRMLDERVEACLLY